MQIHAAGGLPPSPAALPPGLLGGPGAGPAGLPTSIALLAGIPTSLAQAGPHPAFASLLAQQKPTVPDPVIRPKDEELKRAIADTNGSKWPDIFALDLALLCFSRHYCVRVERVHVVAPFMLNEPYFQYRGSSFLLWVGGQPKRAEVCQIGSH